jgi:hypothetical protein
MYHIHFAVRIASTLFPGRRLTGPTLPDGSAAFFPVATDRGHPERRFFVLALAAIRSRFLTSMTGWRFYAISRRCLL